jgi:hypothetical protein
LAKELGFPLPDETGAILPVTIQTENDAAKRTLLFHCAGEIYGKALAELLETERDLIIVEDNEFFVEIAGEIGEIDLTFTEKEINRMLSRRWKNFENAFDLGCFQKDLPNEIRQYCVAKALVLKQVSRAKKSALI